MSNKVKVFIVLGEFFGTRSEAEMFASHWNAHNQDPVSIWKAVISAKRFKQVINRTERRPAQLA